MISSKRVFKQDVLLFSEEFFIVFSKESKMEPATVKLTVVLCIKHLLSAVACSLQNNW
jgi:hypothetical protein